MTPTRDLIAAIRKALPRGEDPDFWLADQLSRAQAVRRERAAFLQAIQVAEDDLKERVKAVRADIQKLQAGCPHWTSTYHPDPAGGRDSWYECDFCGKDLG